MVDPEFASITLEFYNQKKSLETPLNPLILQKIQKDFESPLPSTIKAFSVNITNLLLIICCFLFKRPDISYYYGMHHIVIVLFSVFSTEADVFVMFCHIIENIYPGVIVI
jgi:Rab-GTPase-TBC domain